MGSNQGFHFSWCAVTVAPAKQQAEKPAKYQQSNKIRENKYFFPEILWQTSKYLVSCCFWAFWTFSFSEILALNFFGPGFFRSRLVQVKHRNKSMFRSQVT